MYRFYNMLVTIKNRNSSNEIIQKDYRSDGIYKRVSKRCRGEEEKV